MSITWLPLLGTVLSQLPLLLKHLYLTAIILGQHLGYLEKLTAMGSNLSNLLDTCLQVLSAALIFVLRQSCHLCRRSILHLRHQMDPQFRQLRYRTYRQFSRFRHYLFPQRQYGSGFLLKWFFGMIVGNYIMARIFDYLLDQRILKHTSSPLTWMNWFLLNFLAPSFYTYLCVKIIFREMSALLSHYLEPFQLIFERELRKVSMMYSILKQIKISKRCHRKSI